ncbi:MAG: hypothetical protein ACOVP4_10505 [Bacteriovoracaceae bacterium]
MNIELHKIKLVRDFILVALPTLALIFYCLINNHIESLPKLIFLSLIVTLLFLWGTGLLRLFTEVFKIANYELLEGVVIDNNKIVGSRGVPFFYPSIEIESCNEKMHLILKNYKMVQPMIIGSRLAILFDKNNPHNSVIVDLNPYLKSEKLAV